MEIAEQVKRLRPQAGDVLVFSYAEGAVEVEQEKAAGQVSDLYPGVMVVFLERGQKLELLDEGQMAVQGWYRRQPMPSIEVVTEILTEAGVVHPGHLAAAMMVRQENAESQDFEPQHLRDVVPDEPSWLSEACPGGRTWDNCDAGDCGVADNGTGCRLAENDSEWAEPILAWQRQRGVHEGRLV